MATERQRISARRHAFLTLDYNVFYDKEEEEARRSREEAVRPASGGLPGEQRLSSRAASSPDAPPTNEAPREADRQQRSV